MPHPTDGWAKRVSLGTRSALVWVSDTKTLTMIKLTTPVDVL